VSRPSSALHQVHAGCGERIEHRKTCAIHGEVTNEQIVKAYTYAPGDDLMLATTDLARLSSVDDETIRVEHLAAAAHVDLGLLSGRTLWLVPAHAHAASDYLLILECLARANNWIIGSVVLSDHRQPVAIHGVDGRLVMHVLHWPAQLRSCPTIAQVHDRRGSDAIRALFEKSLVELRREFSWSEYIDEFEQHLTELVRDKIAARTKAPTTLGTAPKGNRARKEPTAVAAFKPRRARAA
jgi:Ku protein